MDPQPKPLVLVVDDAIINIQIINQMLKSEYRVIFATQGSKAIEIAQAQKPDVILIDVVMPEMDGFQTIAHIRDHNLSPSSKVVFLTTLNDEESVQKARELGATGLIHKPVDPGQLSQILHVCTQ